MSMSSVRESGDTGINSADGSSLNFSSKGENTFFRCRSLEEKEIFQAQQLLFEVYCEAQQWLPSPNNPSGLQVVTSDEGTSRLTDRYDFECNWFGCFAFSPDSTSERDGQLIGVHRLHNGQSSSLPFDVEHYVDLPSEFCRKDTVEAARLAIHPDFQGSHAMLSLLNHEHQWIKSQGVSQYITTATFPSPGKMYLKMGMRKHSLPSFYYSEDDESPCNLLYFKFGDERSEKAVSRYISLVTRLEAKKGVPSWAR